jgi:SulP family sulfate permease
MITTYSAQLAEVGGRLYLSGVDPAMIERYRNSYAHDTRGDIQVFEATEVVGESTLRALDDARTWLVSHTGQTGDDTETSES